MNFTNPDPKDRGWRGAPLHWQIAHVIGIALPALVFWFAPDDVLTRYPVLASITGVLKEWIPSVRNVATFSTFPQVAELGMSAIFSCALFLVPVFYLGKTLVRSRRVGYTVPVDPKQIRLTYFLALVLGPICILGFLTMGPDVPGEAAELLRHEGTKLDRIMKGIWLDNRIASGIMASTISASMAALIAVIEVNSFLLFMDKIKRK